MFKGGLFCLRFMLSPAAATLYAMLMRHDNRSQWKRWAEVARIFALHYRIPTYDIQHIVKHLFAWCTKAPAILHLNNGGLNSRILPPGTQMIFEPRPASAASIWGLPVLEWVTTK